jgi:asparagine synthase (glutamine-hydrolysing)
MIVDPDRIVMRSYWSLDPQYELRLGSDRDYADAFRDLFTRAVRCRLRGASAIGVELSGGLDSSSVTCISRDLLRNEGRDQPHAFSGIFSGERECDEREVVGAVVDAGSITPHLWNGDAAGLPGDLERLTDWVDQPFASGMLWIHWRNYAMAKEQGVRVMLDGLDGDTTLTHGIGHLIKLFSRGRWFRLHRELTLLASHFNRSPWGVFVGDVLSPVLPESFLWLWRSLKGRRRIAWLDGNVISSDLLRRTGLVARICRPASWSLQTLRHPRILHWRALMSDELTSAFECIDAVASAHSVELRHPFADRRVVEFCMALPTDQKLRDGWDRAILRRALQGTIPKPAQWRRGKARISLGLVRRLYAVKPAQLEPFLASPSHPIHGYVDRTAVIRLEKRYDALARPKDAYMLWFVLALARWLDKLSYPG